MTRNDRIGVFIKSMVVIFLHHAFIGIPFVATTYGAAYLTTSVFLQITEEVADKAIWISVFRDRIFLLSFVMFGAGFFGVLSRALWYRRLMRAAFKWCKKVEIDILPPPSFKKNPPLVLGLGLIALALVCEIIMRSYAITSNLLFMAFTLIVGFLGAALLLGSQSVRRSKSTENAMCKVGDSIAPESPTIKTKK